jgi:hypothetical protein
VGASRTKGVITVIIECSSCPVRGHHCGDCMVTALVDPPTAQLRLDAAERTAVTHFVRAGLVSPTHAQGLRARREPGGSARAVG